MIKLSDLEERPDSIVYVTGGFLMKDMKEIVALLEGMTSGKVELGEEEFRGMVSDRLDKIETDIDEIVEAVNLIGNTLKAKGMI